MGWLTLLFVMLSGAVCAGSDGFVPLFNGKTLNGWFIVNKQGPGFVVEHGVLVCPVDGGQKLMTEKEYANFVFRFEFRLEADSNNGIGIRAPRDGHTSTLGMEIQILDQTGPKYGPMKLHPEQYHGSIYDVIPARTGFLKKPGMWNEQEITANGRRITIKLNGVIILDADLDMVREPEVLKKHPGLARSGGSYCAARAWKPRGVSESSHQSSSVGVRARRHSAVRTIGTVAL